MKHQRWAVAALSSFLLALAGCAGLERAVKTPELTLGEARVVGMSLTDMQLEFDVDVKNPNPFGLNLQGLSYALRVQDRPVTNGTLGQGMALVANGSSRVRLPFTLRYEDVLGTLLALRDHKELRYQLGGEADFGLLRLPYNKSGTLVLPSLPTIGVESVRVQRMDMQGAELMLALKVGNGNSFPLRLDGLDYQLKLADASPFKGSSTAPLSVQAGQQGLLNLNLRLDYAQVAALLPLLGQAKNLPVDFSSQLRLPGLRGSTALPYRWQGEVPLAR